MAVTLTEAAQKEIKNVVEDQKLDLDKTYLRVGISSISCGGMNYLLDLTEQKDDGDEEWESGGIKVICDSNSSPHLNGASLDFRDEANGRGFIFDNPNQTSSCGSCGTGGCG